MKKWTVLMSLIMGIGLVQAADVANVNGKSISSDDIKEALSGFNDLQRKEILKDPNSRREIVQSLVDQELLLQEGEKTKLDQSEEYKKALANFRKQFISAKVLEKNLSSKLTPAATKKFYEDNGRKYSTDKVQVQHILLDTEAKANEVLALTKAKGADFQKLAEAHSKDPSVKQNRGEIGIVTWDSPFVQEFKEASFAGKKGEVVGPIKTSFGYHLIKILDKKLGKVLNYEEVELKVKNDLKQLLVEGYMLGLRKNAKITLDDKSINQL